MKTQARKTQAPDAHADGEVIRRIAGGDRAAMMTLYQRHHLRVFRFLIRMVRNEATAEELVSDVFLDVWRQAGAFEGRSSATTWLLGIARFKALSQLRRRTDAPLDDAFAEALEDDADDPEVSAQKTDKAAIMRACLGRLSPGHAEVIDLVYYHEQGVDAVARILGIPANTVKTRLFHARKRLAGLLADAGVDRGWP